MFLRLIYTSVAKSEVSSQLLEDILNQARRNNARAGLTGMLVANESRFFQVLEGPEAALDACYARILADPRHGRLRMLARDHTAQRIFGDWRMGHVDPEALNPAAREAVFSLYALAGSGTDVLAVDDKAARLTRSFLASFGLMGLAGQAAARKQGITEPFALKGADGRQP